MYQTSTFSSHCLLKVSKSNIVHVRPFCKILYQSNSGAVPGAIHLMDPGISSALNWTIYHHLIMSWQGDSRYRNV